MAIVIGSSLLYWCTQDVGLNDDSLGQLRDWWSLSRGGSTYYPLGYPVFLGCLEFVGLIPIGGLSTLLQQILGCLATWWLYRILASFLPEATALTAAALTHVFPATLAMHQAVCSESLAHSTVIGSLWYCVRLHDSMRAKDAIAAGLLAGVACTIRVAPIAAFLTGLVIVSWGGDWRRRWLNCGIGVCAAGCFILLCCSVGWLWSGHFGPANSIEGHLFNRIINEQGLVNHDGIATRRIVALAGPLHKKGSEHTAVRVRLEQCGMSYEGSMQLLGRAAWEGVGENWLAYGSYSIRQSVMQLFMNPEMPVGNESSFAPAELTWAPVCGATLTASWALRKVRGAQGLLWPFCATVACLGFVRLVRSRRVETVAWATAAPALLLCQAAIEQSIPRYTVPVVAFVVPMTVVGMLCIVGLVNRCTPRLRAGEV